MDKLTQYRSLIQKLLTDYRQLGQSKPDEDTDQLAFDPERDQYLWFQSGWPCYPLFPIGHSRGVL